MFSITALLITSFVLLYTSGIEDANYNQSIFGILLIIGEALYLLKMPHLNLAYAANKFKEITKPALIETSINIILSILLVKKYKLIGVAIGTCVAMLYRLAFHVKFTQKLINRNKWTYYKKILLFLITNSIAIIVCLFFVPKMKLSIISWITHAMIYSTIVIMFNTILSLIFFKDELLYMKKYLKIK